jgi:hypothetical protein
MIQDFFIPLYFNSLCLYTVEIFISCVFAQLPMQSLPIITDVSMNLDQGDVYNIM